MGDNKSLFRKFMYWVIIISTWAIYWGAGKFLIDCKGWLNFGKFALFGAMVIGVIRYLILEHWWRKIK